MASDGIEQKSAKPGIAPESALANETSTGVVEVAGVIKWFDVAKGYGFIVPDNGMADVLLHVTCLRRDGYQTAYEGSRVACEVLAGPKGLQAFRIISMDESTAVHPAQLPPPRTHVTVAPTSTGQMVQSASWFRFPHTRGGDTRYLRAHGNLAPLRHDRIAPRPVCAGAPRPWPQRADGGRGPAGERPARTGIALAPSRQPVRKALTRIAAIATTLLLVGWAVVAAPARAAGQDTIEIVTRTGVHAFAVELATNEAERAVGLMFRKELPEGRGMLFDFHEDQPVQFWMHNTYIPLDMIFIARDGRIVRVAENAKPMSDDLVPSGRPVRAVLEVIAGTARKLGIAAGDRVVGSFFGKSGGR